MHICIFFGVFLRSQMYSQRTLLGPIPTITAFQAYETSTRYRSSHGAYSI